MNVTARSTKPLAEGPALPVRTLLLASIGGTLEFYDFVIFVYFTDVIGRLFFPPDVPAWVAQLQALAIFGVGYLARPLGGVLMGHFGDRFGRKRMFMLSVALMAIPTILMGCLPVYSHVGYVAPILLIILRVLQGAAIGGEAPGAWVFVSEHASERRTGFVCGLLAGGLTSGILLGSLTATAIKTIYSPSDIAAFAWRVPFIVGGLFGLISIYLRRWLPETPVFEAMRARLALEATLPLKVVLKEHLRSIVLSMALTWTLTAIIVVVILMGPTLSQKLNGVPPLLSLHANNLATLALAVSVVVTGLMIDRHGTRPVAAILCPVMMVAVYVMFSRATADPTILFLVSLVTGLAAGLVTLVPVAMVRSFPGPVRFTGVAFSYNVAYAIAGGVTPVMVQAWAHQDRLGPAHYVCVCTAVGLIATFISGRTVTRTYQTADSTLQ
jgi:MFS family permease